MPWCPNCKTEYQDGFNTCADCGADLIEDMETAQATSERLCELVDLDSEEDTRKLVEFLEYSGIRDTSFEYFEETTTWKIWVNTEDIKEAIKLYNAFKIAETTEEEKVDLTNKIKEENYKNHTYVKKEDKYNDFKSSVTVFIPFGILGLIFVVFNMVGILNFLSSPIQFIVLGLCFIGFIYVGVSSMLKLKSIKEEISQEQNHTSSINKWMEEHITPEILEEVTDDTMSDEYNYIHQTDKMKEMVLEQFGDMDESFVDQLVEDFYNQHIDSNK